MSAFPKNVFEFKCSVLLWIVYTALEIVCKLCSFGSSSQNVALKEKKVRTGPEKVWLFKSDTSGARVHNAQSGRYILAEYGQALVAKN